MIRQIFEKYILKIHKKLKKNSQQGILKRTKK
jgi:hypothetical protein